MKTSFRNSLKFLTVFVAALLVVAVGIGFVPERGRGEQAFAAETSNDLWSDVIEAKLNAGYSGSSIWPSLYTATGEEDDPYVIETAEQLAFFAYVVNNSKMNSSAPEGANAKFRYVEDDKTGVNQKGYAIGNFSFAGKYVRLAADVDLSAHYWERIGFQYFTKNASASASADGDSSETGNESDFDKCRPFLGNFSAATYDADGDHIVGLYTISGLVIDETQNIYKAVSQNGTVVTTGLFGYVGARYDLAYYSDIGNNEDAAKYNFDNYEGQKQNSAVIAGTVTNVKVVGAKITVRYSAYAGIIAGVSSGVLADCYAYGSVQANGYQTTTSSTSNPFFGGVAGYTRNGDVIQCRNYASVVSDKQTVGGVVGRAGAETIGMEPRSIFRNDSVIGCFNFGDVTGGLAVGGIVGYSTGMVDSAWGGQYRIFSCHNEGKITHTGKVNNAFAAAGGIVGYCYAGAIQGSYNTYPLTDESGNPQAGVLLASDASYRNIPLGGLVGNGGVVVNASYSYAYVASDVSTLAGALFGIVGTSEPTYYSYYVAGSVPSGFADTYASGKADNDNSKYKKMDYAKVDGTQTAEVIKTAFGWANLPNPLIENDKNWVFTDGNLPTLSVRTLKERHENVSVVPYEYDGKNKEIEINFYNPLELANEDYGYTLEVFRGSKIVSDGGSGYLNRIQSVSRKISDGRLTLEIKDAGEYLIVVRAISADLTGYFYGEYSYVVDKKELKVSIENKSAVYGSTAAAFADYEVSGLVEGDTVEGTVGRKEGNNVGVYPYDLSTLRIKNASGDDSENYALGFEPVGGKIPSYTITRKEIKITDVASLTMPYGNVSSAFYAEKANVSAVVSVQSGVLAGDSVEIKELRFSGAETSPLDAGEYTGRLKIVEVVLSNDNYFVNVAGMGNVTLIVTQVQIVVEAIGPVTKPYAQDYTSFENYGFVVKTSLGEVLPDSVVSGLRLKFRSEGAEVSATPGTYDVFVDSIGNRNYKIDFEKVVGSLIVKDRPIISLRTGAEIRISNKYYDGTNLAALAENFVLTSGLFDGWDGSIMTVLPHADFFFSQSGVGQDLTVDVVFTVPDNSPYGMLKTKYTAVAKADIQKREVVVDVSDSSAIYGDWNAETGKYDVQFTLSYAFAGDGLTDAMKEALGKELSAVLLKNHTLKIADDAKYAGTYSVSGDVNFDEAALENFFLKRGSTVQIGRDDSDSATVTVKKRTIVISDGFLSSSSREYDGTTDISIKVDGVSKKAGDLCFFVHSTGVLAEDSVNLGENTGLYFTFTSEFTSPNVGQGTAVVRLTLHGANKSSYAFEGGSDSFEVTISGVEIIPRKLTVVFTKRIFEAEFGTDPLAALDYNLVGIDGLEAEKAEIKSNLIFGIKGKPSSDVLIPGLYEVTFGQNPALTNYEVNVEEGKITQIRIVTALVGELTFEQSEYNFVYGDKVQYPVPMIRKNGVTTKIDQSKMTVSLSLKLGDKVISMADKLNAGEYILVCTATAKDGYAFANGTRNDEYSCHVKIAKKEVYVAAPETRTVQGNPADLEGITGDQLVYYFLEDGVPVQVDYSSLGDVSGTFLLSCTNQKADRAGTFNITFTSDDFALKSTNFKFIAITSETAGFGSEYVGKLIVSDNDNTTVVDEETGIVITGFNDNAHGELTLVVTKITDTGVIEGQLTEKQKHVFSFEIAIEKDGEIYKCKNNFTVRIPLPSGYGDVDFDVKVLDEEGNIVNSVNVEIETDENGVRYAKFITKGNQSYAFVASEKPVTRKGNDDLIYILIAAGGALILIATVVAIVLVKRSQRAQKDSEVLAQNAVESVKDDRFKTPEDVAIQQALRNRNAVNPQAPIEAPASQVAPQAAPQAAPTMEAPKAVSNVAPQPRPQNPQPQQRPQAPSAPQARPNTPAANQRPTPQVQRPTTQAPRPAAPQAPQKLTPEQRAEMIRRASRNQNGDNK